MADMTVEQALDYMVCSALVLENDGQDYTAGQLRQVLATFRAELDGLRVDAEKWRDLERVKRAADSEPQSTEWKKLAVAGHYVEAVKAARAALGCGLVEARAVVDAAMQESSHEP